MINFIKKYWKYLVCVFGVLIIIFLSYFYYQKNNSISTPKVEKLSLVKEEKKEGSTVFVDVKGAVNAPGVYELDDDKRVIDAINLAGGLAVNADTVNLNLSKKLADEMYIIVYTKDEIYNYKKNNESNNKIECASFECVCPDINNNACISDDKNSNISESKKDNQTSSSLISINNASKEELMSLTGIGESKADAIISYRKENGLFKDINDIKNVSGIGDALYDKIKDKITL